MKRDVSSWWTIFGTLIVVFSLIFTAESFGAGKGPIECEEALTNRKMNQMLMNAFGGKPKLKEGQRVIPREEYKITHMVSDDNVRQKPTARKKPAQKKPPKKRVKLTKTEKKKAERLVAPSLPTEDKRTTYTKADIVEALKAIDPNQSKDFANSPNFDSIELLRKSEARDSGKVFYPFMATSLNLRNADSGEYSYANWLDDYLEARTKFTTARNLEAWAVQLFGSMREALGAAGIQSWSRPLILDILKGIYYEVAVGPTFMKAELLKLKTEQAEALQMVLDWHSPFPAKTEDFFAAIESGEYFPGGLSEALAALDI